MFPPRAPLFPQLAWTAPFSYITGREGHPLVIPGDCDVVLLTEQRYENPSTDRIDGYIANILEEDRLLATALRRRGQSVQRLDWARPDVDWSRPRTVVFRTPWDYFFRFREFSTWLEHVASCTRLVNCASQVRWNMDKRYLAELAERGLPVVPTHYVPQAAPVSLPEILEQQRWNEAVLKPVVSGAARHTYRVDRTRAAELDRLFVELVGQEAMLVQAFQHDVLTGGELALVVLGGRCTHAVRKIPKAGDFRVQDDHGGTVHPHRPAAEEIELAERAVAACTPAPAYARVDVIRDNEGRLAIMELELVEPELFLRFRPEAADVLACCLAAELSPSVR